MGAIDDLTRRNRIRRDPHLERQLVEARHAAFGELPTEPGRSAWLPSLPDPFAGVQDLPVIEASQITPAVVGGAIANHGCLRIDHLIDRATVDGLTDQIDRAFDGRQRLAARAAPTEVAPWFVPFEPGLAEASSFSSSQFVRVVDSPGIMWEIVEIFTNSGLTAAVTEYFGERPTMIAHKWVVRRAWHGADGTDFHQDGAFLGEGIRTINCWIALSDCGPGTDRPSLELIPHRYLDIMPTGVGARHTWSLAEPTVMQSLPEVHLARPRMGAGDALLFDERMPHRTSYGPDLNTRYAIESWFVAPSSSNDRHELIVL